MRLLGCLMLLFLCSCQTQQPKYQISPNDYLMTSANAESDFVEPMGGKIPHEMNESVNKWLRYWQGRGRKYMNLYLSRSSRYLPLMKQILREEGLPEGLVYVPLIESGFSSSIRSHASAVGYWQFIRGTGRRYGLKINHLMDERRDFVKATYAAVNYFKSLYSVFGSWYLALAAYNTGENRVQRALMRNKTRDFWVLVKKKQLPRETLNYVPKFLAARMVATNPVKYGFVDVAYAEPLAYSEIHSNKAVNLRKWAKNLGVSYYELKRLNPSFLTEYAPKLKNRPLTLRAPIEKASLAATALSKSYGSSKVSRRLARESQSKTITHRVRRGDTLIHIARRYGTSVSTLRRANRLNRRSMIRIGQRLKVPTSRIQAKAHRDLKKTSKRQKKIHVVRRGDTLIHIAKRYRVNLRRLALANGLTSRSKILIGRKLVIP